MDIEKIVEIVNCDKRIEFITFVYIMHKLYQFMEHEVSKKLMKNVIYPISHNIQLEKFIRISKSFRISNIDFHLEILGISPISFKWMLFININGCTFVNTVPALKEFSFIFDNDFKLNFPSIENIEYDEDNVFINEIIKKLLHFYKTFVNIFRTIEVSDNEITEIKNFVKDSIITLNSCDSITGCTFRIEFSKEKVYTQKPPTKYVVKVCDKTIKFLFSYDRNSLENKNLAIITTILSETLPINFNDCKYVLQNIDKILNEFYKFYLALKTTLKLY